MHQTNTKTATQDSIQQVTGDEIWPWAWRSRGPGGRSCSVVWYWRTVYHSTLCQMEGWRTVCVRGGWGLSQCWPPYGCGVWCKCLRWRGEWLRWWFQPSSPLAAGSCGPQPSQEVETLLGFLHDGGGVEGPGNVPGGHRGTLCSSWSPPGSRGWSVARGPSEFSRGQQASLWFCLYSGTGCDFAPGYQLFHLLSVWWLTELWVV